MKKLLGILVLGLLWCNTLFGESSLPPCQGEDTQWTNCFGTDTSPDGRKYVGEFKDGKPHGQGTFTYSNGDKYVGEFKDGIRHGQGTLTYVDGDKYVGEFRRGEFHGLGKYKCSSIKEDLGILDCKPGRIIKGIWEDNRLVNVMKLNF